MTHGKFAAAAVAMILGAALPGCAREEADVDDVPDSVVIENLRDAGSDLTKPHDVDFNLYFPDEAAARRVGAKLSGDGYQVSVDPADDEWSVEATKSMRLDAAEITRVGNSLKALA